MAPIIPIVLQTHLLVLKTLAIDLFLIFDFLQLYSLLEVPHFGHHIIGLDNFLYKLRLGFSQCLRERLRLHLAP